VGYKFRQGRVVIICFFVCVIWDLRWLEYNVWNDLNNPLPTSVCALSYDHSGATSKKFSIKIKTLCTMGADFTVLVQTNKQITTEQQQENSEFRIATR
jgi:hypothetical protein